MSLFDGLDLDWPDDGVLFEDDFVIAVDKPAGMPVDAQEARGAGDVVRRVRARLTRLARAAHVRRDVSSAGSAPYGHDPTRDDERVYVGVVHRLERDASGVCLLSKRREANGPLVRALESGAWQWTYELSVSGSTRRGQTVGPTSQRAAQLFGGLVPPRGAGRRARARTHDARTAEASRTVRVTALRVPHPATGRELSIRARPTSPDADRDTLATLDDINVVRSRLVRAIDRRWVLARDNDTTAYRLANDAADGFPDTTIDRYDRWALVQFYSDAARQFDAFIAGALIEAGAAGVYVKLRPKQASTLGAEGAKLLAPSDVFAGTAAPADLVMTESGLEYVVRLADGLSTGIFLDQRENRRRVRGAAKGRRVLNLFAYTCAFTVAAVAGGATESVSIDAAPGALARGRANLAAISADAKAHTLIVADAIAWLEAAAARRERYDLIVVDPPSFATTKSGTRFSAEDDYGDLMNRVLPVASAGGLVLACTNHRGVSKSRFRRMLAAAAQRAGVDAELRESPDPEDFPAPAGGECHLKSVWMTLG